MRPAEPEQSRAPLAMQALGGMCCCSDPQDRNQMQFANTASTDEAVQIGDGRGQPGAHMNPVMPSPQATDASTTRSLTEAEKQAEKTRLQTLVNTFAKRAVSGSPCWYIKEGTGQRMATQYRVDKSLEHLIIVNPKDPKIAEVTCPIAAIQDIYSYVEDGEQCFPADVLKSVEPTEKDLMLMVVYRNGSGKMFRFCLFEASTESRDMFLECLRILCIYAQSAPNATA